MESLVGGRGALEQASSILLTYVPISLRVLSFLTNNVGVMAMIGLGLRSHKYAWLEID